MTRAQHAEFVVRGSAPRLIPWRSKRNRTGGPLYADPFGYVTAITVIRRFTAGAITTKRSDPLVLGSWSSVSMALSSTAM